MNAEQLREQIFHVSGETFEPVALEIFRYQYSANKVYRDYCELTGVSETAVFSSNEIPFLPIEFFKTHRIVSGNCEAQKLFSSSGTTGQQTSRHYVCDLKLYEESFLRCFEKFFGPPAQYSILALLPSYLERNDSSLVYMVEGLMKQSSDHEHGFFLHDYEKLSASLLSLEKKTDKTMLIGVSFALLDPSTGAQEASEAGVVHGFSSLPCFSESAYTRGVYHQTAARNPTFADCLSQRSESRGQQQP